MKGGVCAEVRRTLAVDGGCCIKPSEKTRRTLREMHARAAVRDDLATDRPHVTDAIAVFGAHPYKRSSGLAGCLCDSLDDQQQLPVAVLLLDDRSAVGAGAAPPQKQRSRERRLRPAVQLLVVRGESLHRVVHVPAFGGRHKLRVAERCARMKRQYLRAMAFRGVSMRPPRRR
jgi:hypothetical protein